MFASILSGLLKALSSIFGWLQQNQLVKAGEDGANVAQLKEQVHDIEVAVQAREEVRSANAGVPLADSLPDDGFRRD